MAHHKSALKRIRQTKKKNIYNRLNKKAIKEVVKAVRQSKSFEEANTKLVAAYKVLDKVTAHGVIHRNNAANKKSSLANYVNSLKESKN